MASFTVSHTLSACKSSPSLLYVYIFASPRPVRNMDGYDIQYLLRSWHIEYKIIIISDKAGLFLLNVLNIAQLSLSRTLTALCDIAVLYVLVVGKNACQIGVAMCCCCRRHHPHLRARTSHNIQTCLVKLRRARRTHTQRQATISVHHGWVVIQGEPKCEKGRECGKRLWPSYLHTYIGFIVII